MYFLPLLITFALLLFGRGVVVSALSGLASVFAVVLFTGMQLPLTVLPEVAYHTVLLAASAAVVILAGQYLNLLLQQKGTVRELSQGLADLAIARPLKTLLIVLGVAPAVESLTGFGVSLFLCVPLLFGLYGAGRVGNARGAVHAHEASQSAKVKAAKVSLLSMQIMPWGTLALATLVGASIAGVSARQLGMYTSLSSFLVFPVIGLVVAFLISRDYKIYLCALAMALLLSLQLVLYNYLFALELAGILAGLGTVVLGGFLFKGGNMVPSRSALLSTSSGLLRAVRPYIILLLLIIFARASYPWWQEFSNALALQSDGVRFEWLASPAIFLALTAFYVHASSAIRLSFSEVWRKSAKPIVSIFLFLLLAQCMLAAGMLSQMVDFVLSVGGEQSYLLSPLVGMLSGYITGSNLGGNALMMHVQSQLGAATGQVLLFSALQNSGAGHAVFASLPVIVLVISIAKSMHVEIEEKVLVRFSIVALVPIYLAITLAAFLLHSYF